MNTILELFDKSKKITRKIEKVINYNTTDEQLIKDEISEYVATENIIQNFGKILDAMEVGMEAGSNQIGIWVSGFYGSGKSSFTKNLGFALNKNITIEGISFLKRLQDRIDDNLINSRFNSVIRNHHPFVLMIDLATQYQISGYTATPVSTLIYNQVMKFAGYATEEKVALLERKLENDGRYEEFKQEVEKEHGNKWDEIKKDNLEAKTVASTMANRFYPQIWKDAKTFNILRIDSIENEQERTLKMLELIEKKTGQKNIVFILDEVGQYISSNEELILQMQGFLENVKNIGKGKVWVIATAQQTLTEDNPNARLNSEKIFKLNDRFPVKVEIEPTDIKEICTKRLLGKSNEGNEHLKEVFKIQGDKLKYNIKLTNIEKTIFKADFDEKSFIDLYPFIPYHFNILLALLGKLSRISGGIGLRSTIKVIQEILIERNADNGLMFAEHPIGKLATIANIYDIMRSDIRKSYSYIVAAVDKVVQIYGSSFETQVAKSIAVLQILDDFYLSSENLAALMLPNVFSDSILPTVKAAVAELKNNKSIALNEIEGKLRFMTDAIISLEIEKNKVFTESKHLREIIEGRFKEIFQPVPSVKLLQTKTIDTDIYYIDDSGKLFRTIDNNKDIKLNIKFATQQAYKQLTADIQIISTETANKNNFYLIGIEEDDWIPMIQEIHKCETIYGTRNRYNDKEINDYLNGQQQEANKLKLDLKQKMVNGLLRGEMIFRGSASAVKTLSDNLRNAVGEYMKDVAAKVFEKYEQAPTNADTALAEKLMATNDLSKANSSLNILDLIKPNGAIDTEAKPIVSIKEYLAQSRTEGRTLLNYFAAPPFGWNKETTRYIVAAMFYAGVIKFRINAEEIMQVGPKSIQAVKNINAFNGIGISLSAEQRPSLKTIQTARQNLISITGETNIPPTERGVSECVRKHFPDLLNRYAVLPEKLSRLGIEGEDRARGLQQSISNCLSGDASNATPLLGKENSELFNDLQWAKKTYDTINQDVTKNILKVGTLKKAITELPHIPILEELKHNSKVFFEYIDDILKRDNFYESLADINSFITEIEILIDKTCDNFLNTENQKIAIEIQKIEQSQIFAQLNADDKSTISQQLNNLTLKAQNGIAGIQNIVKCNYGLSAMLHQTVADIEELLKGYSAKKPVKITLRKFKTIINSATEIDEMVKEITELKTKLTDDNYLIINR